jgi:hypothetical protein
MHGGVLSMYLLNDYLYLRVQLKPFSCHLKKFLSDLRFGCRSLSWS